MLSGANLHILFQKCLQLSLSMFNFGTIKTSLSYSSPDLSSSCKSLSLLARHASMFSCFYPRFSSLHGSSCSMEFRGLREVKVDRSPSGSSDSSWSSSFLPSSELTSISSDQLLAPLTAPCFYKPFEEQPRTSAMGSCEDKMKEVVWRETSFLGDDE